MAGQVGLLKFINRTGYDIKIGKGFHAIEHIRMVGAKAGDPASDNEESNQLTVFTLELENGPLNLGGPKKLSFPISTGQKFIDPFQVTYVSAEDNVAILHLSNKQKVKLTKSLGWVENLLKQRGFCRVHLSYIINFNHINEYIRQDGGYVIMSDKKLISVARRRKEEFLNKLEAWNQQ